VHYNLDEQDEYVSPRMPSSPETQKLDKIVNSVINGNQLSDVFFAHVKITLRDVEKVQK